VLQRSSATSVAQHDGGDFALKKKKKLSRPESIRGERQRIEVFPTIAAYYPLKKAGTVDYIQFCDTVHQYI
jgi:hypothetical protein